ncbi:uncharacterized protein LOC108606168 [Drosophila busckii]|uniref:uncharacterized protein LOC108606168 n=1 Tax=Drosophila busckii TaxID=30019 RepID=UPI001432E271|nr:uncharacterized protein LOC108606168 [Drosophila busckii]
MWLTDCITMTRYKQTEFTEDDSSSIGGIQLNEATGHTGMQIRYHTARATWNWRSRNKTEKWLLITTFVMAIVILTLLIMLYSNGGSGDGGKQELHLHSHKKDCWTASERPCLNEHCIFASSEILKSIASEAGFRISLLPEPAKSAESVNLEHEAIPSKVLSLYDNSQQKISNLAHPTPLLDSIQEHEKYGNNGDKFDNISRSIVNGYEAFSNFLNSLIQKPKEVARSVSKGITAQLDIIGGKLVGL